MSCRSTSCFTRGGEQTAAGCVWPTGKARAQAKTWETHLSGNRGETTHAGCLCRKVPTGELDRGDDHGRGIPRVDLSPVHGRRRHGRLHPVAGAPAGGRPARPGEHHGFRNLPADRHPARGDDPVQCGHEIPLDGWVRRGGGGRLLGAGAEVRRVRRDHRDGPVAQAGIPVDLRRDGGDPRRRTHLGQALRRGAGSPRGRDGQAGPHPPVRHRR